LSEKQSLSGADRSPKVQIAEKVCLHNNMDQCAMWHNAQHCSKVISPNRNAARKVTCRLRWLHEGSETALPGGLSANRRAVFLRKPD
jgi:hypothetical protein